MAKPILLYNAIYPETTKEFTNQLLDIPEDENVDIWINSPGGIVADGWAILAALNSRDNVTMTVTGDAASMAFFMLMFADNAKAFDSSKFMIHRASAGWWESELSDEERGDLDDRNKLLRKKLEAKINPEIFEKVTGKTFDDVFSMEGRLDVFLNAKQAKQIGLINEVIKINPTKKAEIESNYINQIAALSQPKNTNSNINKKSKSMGIMKAIFGEKDSILLGKIGEIQFAYSGLEKGIKVRPIGEGDLPSINGTFEANSKTVTIVNDEITAIEVIDTKQAQIDALTEKITALTTAIGELNKKPEVEPIVEDKKDDEKIAALTAQVDAMAKVITDAKLSTSNPLLPKKEFKQEKIFSDTDMTRRERFAAKQQEDYEAKRNEREKS